MRAYLPNSAQRRVLASYGTPALVCLVTIAVPLVPSVVDMMAGIVVAVSCFFGGRRYQEAA